jgi:hypothetical protein
MRCRCASHSRNKPVEVEISRLASLEFMQGVDRRLSPEGVWEHYRRPFEALTKSLGRKRKGDAAGLRVGSHEH